MSNTQSPRAHSPLRLRLSVQARLHFAQLLLWQILAFMALIAVFLLHSCDTVILHSQATDLLQFSTWQHIWYQASGLDVFWHVALSVLGAVVMNMTLAVNHRPGRYLAM